jgi:hypothetical protein
MRPGNWAHVFLGVRHRMDQTGAAQAQTLTGLFAEMNHATDMATRNAASKIIKA